jgi:hypothetical protein
MKRYLITITRPGCQPLRYEGLFTSAAAAFNDAADRAASPLCGISTRVVKQPSPLS